MSNADDIMLEMDRLLKKASIRTIAPGDTLASIAKQLNLTVNDLIAANPGIKPTSLHPGQAIEIPSPEQVAKNRALNGPPKLNSQADVQLQVDQAIAAACSTFGIKEAIFRGLIYTESRGDYCARSGTGAGGLCQLMPATLTQMNVTDPHDPIQSVHAGAKWLSLLYGEANRMMAKYKPQHLDLDDLALMCYNAGGPRVIEYLKGKAKLTDETMQYPQRVKSALGARIQFNCSNRQV